MRSISAVFDEDRLEDVRRVLARVHGLLELLVDVLPADDVESVVARAEELGDRLVVQPVALVLELLDVAELVRGLSIALAAEESDEQLGDRESVRRPLGVELGALLPLRNERDAA